MIHDSLLNLKFFTESVDRMVLNVGPFRTAPIGIFLKSYGYLSFLSFTICELIFILQNKIYNLVSGKLRPVDAKKSEIN